jgi:hypothetical protein
MTMRILKALVSLPIAFLWVACQTAPGTPIATVKHVDLERFMGD